MWNNTNAIILQKNYAYSTKKAMCMLMLVIFSDDKIKNKEVRVTHCATEKIATDFVSKQVQGFLFRYQRNIVLGLKEYDFDMCKAWHKQVLIKFDR